MSKILDCPHRVSLSSITFYCLKGRFPIDCENCDCKDKRYYEVYTSTNITTIETMMWRSDTPSEDVIVAKLTADFCGGTGRYVVLFLGTQKVLGGSCVCYMEDGEEIPYSAIEKWASLEEGEINGDLESKDLSDLIDKLSKRYPEVSFAKLSRIVVAATKWQKSQDQQTIELAEEHAMLAGMMQERERMMKDDADLATIAHLYGADQMKEIMLNKAVEVEVFDDWQYGKDADRTAQPAIKLRCPELKIGQKVKVIIIKE